MFKIRFDTHLAQRTIADLAKQLGEQQTNRAVASALNRVASQGKTVASRTIRQRYRIKKSQLDKRMGQSRAGAKHLQARIWTSGSPLPVSLFKYRQTKKGVKVSILGKQNVIPGAFVAKMKSGHTGVFARGRYSAKGFEFRKKRINYGHKKYAKDLPISTLYTASEGTMFGQPVVIEPVIGKIEAMLPVRIEHELNYLLSKVR